MRRAARKDHTHKAIKATFESCGCLVAELNGTIDFAVYEPRTQRTYLVDAKTPRKEGGKDALTDSQVKMIADGWPIVIAHSADDVIETVMRWRKS